jgi:4-deoxy-L-threo-5-hexosulose-uronate ketol-isomerase
MYTTIEERWSNHPSDVKHYDTQLLRQHFLVEKVFEAGKVRMTYTHNDRLIFGGALTTSEPLKLETVPLIRSEYFLERRELGIVCVGGSGTVRADGVAYVLGYKDALYLGRGTKDVQFISNDPTQPAKLYFASAPAHTSYPNVLITDKLRRTKELGEVALANERTLNQLVLSEIVPCCQLQMGLTEIKQGSVWNTMPPHTHSRRMEAYFYFNVTKGQTVCHFMGESQETRHIFIQNEQAVISPSWSIHSAAGTSNYSFVWAMCGENLDYNDMDTFQPDELR